MTQYASNVFTQNRRFRRSNEDLNVYELKDQVVDMENDAEEMQKIHIEFQGEKSTKSIIISGVTNKSDNKEISHKR